MTKPKKKRSAAPPRKPAAARQQSKADRVVALLGRDGGATLEEMMKATGWQQHSVRGFFAGVVGKKLGLALNSEKLGKERVYRIKGKAGLAKGKSKRARKSS